MRVIIHKGGKGSGNFNHAGRPGKIGGSVVDGGDIATTEKQRYALSMGINVAYYDKLKPIEHGDDLRQLAENAPYKTREQFISEFNDAHGAEDVLIKPVKPTAKMSEYEKAQEGPLLYAIAKYVTDNRGASTLEITNLAKYSGISRNYLIYGPLYRSDAGVMKYFRYETRANLDQLRIRGMLEGGGQGYRFDAKNGIVSYRQGMKAALKSLGYTDPGKLYDDLMKVKPWTENQ